MRLSIAGPIIAASVLVAGGTTRAGEEAPGPEKAAAPEKRFPARPPAPTFRAPGSAERFREAMKKMAAEDYPAARNLLTACLADAAGPDDRKAILALIDDTRLGSEIEAARKLVERREERKAISAVEKALIACPASALRPVAERFVRETEELIYVLLDDFEPGDGEPGEAGRGGAAPEAGASKGGKGKAAGEPADDGSEPGDDADAPPARPRRPRWGPNQEFNADPRFVKHGKGSLRWKLLGRLPYYGEWKDYYGYCSGWIPKPITNRQYLIFWVYLPEAADGALEVSLAPTAEASTLQSLYTPKAIDLHGVRGWKEVKLDLKRDFGNTLSVRLCDVHHVRITSVHDKVRTIYLDFVHLE